MFDFGNSRASLQSDKKLLLKVFRQAQYSGSLNLSNRSLKEVPALVWSLNSPLSSSSTDDKTAGAAVDFSGEDEFRWWEAQALTKLNLSSNQLSCIDGEGLAKLDSLSHLDLRDNQLVSLPDKISSLVELKSLIVSANQLKGELCPGVSGLNNLVVLDLAANQLTGLGTGLSHLPALQRLDVSQNLLTSLEAQHLPPNLRSLILSRNKLGSLPDGVLEAMPSLSNLDLSSNQLTALVLDRRPLADRQINGSQLTSLLLSMNRLTSPPDVSGFSQLKELSISDNRLTSFPLECFQGCCELITLDMARNKLSQLPPRGLACALPKLARFDLSSNDLSCLPSELGTMASLQVLMVDLNPLRSIRPNILSGGTEAIKALLRQRYQPVEDDSADKAPMSHDESKNVLTETKQLEQLVNKTSHSPTVNANGSDVPVISSHGETETTKATVSDPVGSTVKNSTVPMTSQYTGPPLPTVSNAGVLQWSGGTGVEVPPLPDLSSPAVWLSATRSAPEVSDTTCPRRVPQVKELRLDHRRLTVFPLGLLAFAPTLSVLNLSYNQLSSLPEEIDQLQRLSNLDLSKNRLHSLPEGLSRLSALIILCLDSNPLGPDLDPSVENVLLTGCCLSGCLEHLSLRACQLRQVPSAKLLAGMTKLVHLDLTDNDIANVPPELGLCSQLKALHLTGNSFRVPRPAILSKGTTAILEYLRSRIPD